MADGSAAKLYSPKLLALATSLADFPLNDSFETYAEARSRTCGSRVKIGLSSAEGRISRVGMQVSACAVGQSSAAIFAQGIQDTPISDLTIALGQIERWLSEEGDLPDWPMIDALIPALPYSGRHEAVLLPWRAAIEALSSTGSSSY
ncbi:iron-sulfur cluster assembly scaffold protein [Erythrobacter sp. F6033]|uniref:iron-sulfur cluster assembly scaffold protein n=1 Tax=Erythrobacter sp. F6033 TaxID=2926401 RepID=UPI001FF5868D|nr:iron-sulfur cluster assembly scaffold protein [Erythrobacter sp. F6033]MCK0128377.1 iron-sulfur cluster assembly scaffold protein [Erythrobacter sp. F6033]